MKIFKVDGNDLYIFVFGTKENWLVKYPIETQRIAGCYDRVDEISIIIFFKKRITGSGGTTSYAT